MRSVTAKFSVSCLSERLAEALIAQRKLSKTAVEKLTPADREVVVWDEALPGFGVRVKPTGAKSHVVQYRNRTTSRSQRKTIGQHGPLITFHQAREKARALLVDVLLGNDPVAEGRAMRRAPTMADLAADYLEFHAIPKKRPSSVRNDRSMIDSIILPRLGKTLVIEVQSRDIYALHKSMHDRPARANRVLALLSKMFSRANKWGWRGDNPVKGVERYHEERRERWRSDTELSRLLKVLAIHPNQRAAHVGHFQLLTGARIGEVLSAKWSDLDLDRVVWTKPSHHTKQKRTEHLPLSGPALALLVELLPAETDRSPFLFPGDAPDKPLQSIKKFRRDVTTQAELEDCRLHDNRHTHASHLVSSGLSLEIVGRLLGHTNPTMTKRCAHIAGDPLRAATERFGRKMDALQEPNKAEVIRLERHSSQLGNGVPPSTWTLGGLQTEVT